MDKQLIAGLINYLLPVVGFLFLLVLLKNALPFLKARQWKWKIFIEKVQTPLFGFFIILSSFALVNAILGAASEFAPALEEELPNPGTLWEAILQIDYTGIFGVLLFITAGTCYILSGFGDWLKWLARAFMVLAPAYLIVQMLRFAVLAG